MRPLAPKLTPIKQVAAVAADVIASVATASSQRLQLAVGHLLQMVDIHVFLARVGKAEPLCNQVIRRPCIRLVPVAFAARVIKVRVVRRFLAEFRDRTKVIDLKELLSAEHGFSTFAVGATLKPCSAERSSDVCSSD